MLKSMTGFGSYKIKDNEFEIKVDIKSVNNRYLDIQVKGPKSLAFMEEDIKNVISSKINRGKIDVFIDIQFLDSSNIDFNIDYNLLKKYNDSLTDLSNLSNLEKSFSVLDILRFDSNILLIERKDLNDNKTFVDLCLSCVDKACSNLLEMKIQEGYNIEYDLKNKLANVKELINKIEDFSEDLVSIKVQSLKERINGILSEENVPLDEDRLLNEIVFYSDKLDIDEEIVRLKSHLDLFNAMIADENSNGKKIDFLIQEMNRETNTIGSKTNSINVTKEVIELKSILEKIREQVQNIEWYEKQRRFKVVAKNGTGIFISPFWPKWCRQGDC